MKVSIDRSTCVSCGSCWDTCPGFFEQNPDDSFSHVIERFRLDEMINTGTPPAELENYAREAADLCTVQVISTGD